MERAGRMEWSTGSAREVEADILAELHAHLEHATEDRIEQGLEPEAARHEAERRFGDFAGVFGACRTEKLKERIMLQRILIMLVAVLAAAVFAQSWLLAVEQRESARAVESLRADLTGMAGRIEEQVAAALLIGGRASQPGRGPSARSETLAEQPVETLAEQPAETLLEAEADAQIGWSAAQALRRADRRRADLVQILRHDPEAADRFEAVDGLRLLALASDEHRERPLRAGNSIGVLVPGLERLSFEACIDPRGNLKVPDLGFIPALGLTRSELELLIQRQFEGYYTGADEVVISKAVWEYAVLIEALEDSDPFVRMAAAQALGEIGDHRALRALQQAAIDDEEQAVRDSATQALERFRGPVHGAVDGPVPGADDDPIKGLVEGPVEAQHDPEQRAEDDRRINLFAVLRYDPDAAKRFEAVDGLRTLALASDEHRERHVRAGDIIEVIVPAEARLSFAANIDPRGNLRVPEVGFIPALGLTRSELELLIQHEFEQYYAGEYEVLISKAAWTYAPLIEALQDSDTFVRHAAAQALGEIGDHRARRALQRAASDDEEQAVRDAAAQALDRFR